MYELLDEVRDANDLTAYREELRKSGSYKDLSKRFRWDLLWAVNGTKRQEWFAEVYEYANNTHVDTVLREWIRLNDL